MNNYTITESAELKYMQILEEFFVSVYDEKYLPSHGIEHHRRVWGYAKELLRIVTVKSVSSLALIPSQLIVACYLHDIGMADESGPKHGKHSSDLCIRFLENNHLEKSDFLETILTIENHDNKEYITSAGKSDLMAILSVADDLDAFGFTGIYRYSEIYLTRGIDPLEIGFLIQENAGRRFNNFVKIFDYTSEFLYKHKKRYEILYTFFTEYNKQIISYHFGEQQPTGYCGVVELLINMKKDKKELNEYVIESDKYQDDPVIKWFFEGMKSELINR